jgi:hypothetical protein
VPLLASSAFGPVGPDFSPSSWHLDGYSAWQIRFSPLSKPLKHRGKEAAEESKLSGFKIRQYCCGNILKISDATPNLNIPVPLFQGSTILASLFPLLLRAFLSSPSQFAFPVPNFTDPRPSVLIRGKFLILSDLLCFLCSSVFQRF